MSKDQERMWKLAGRYSAVGIEMAVAVALGSLFGVWLDKKLGTQPWLTLLGMIFGIGAAANAVVRIVRKTHFGDL